MLGAIVWMLGTHLILVLLRVREYLCHYAFYTLTSSDLGTLSASFVGVDLAYLLATGRVKGVCAHRPLQGTIYLWVRRTQPKPKFAARQRYILAHQKTRNISVSSATKSHAPNAKSCDDNERSNTPDVRCFNTSLLQVHKVSIGLTAAHPGCTRYLHANNGECNKQATW